MKRARRRAVEAGGDVFLLGGIVLVVPAAVLAVGIPIALLIRAVLWAAGLLG